MATGGKNIQIYGDLDAIRYMDEDLNASGDSVEDVENSKAPDEDVIIDETQKEKCPFLVISRLPDRSLRTKIGHFFYNPQKKIILGLGSLPQTSSWLSATAYLGIPHTTSKSLSISSKYP